MKLASTAILAIALACSTFAQEQPATPQVVLRHVTLQVQRERDYSAQEVVRLLGTPAYLGSIARNLVPKDVDKTYADWTIASDPSHAPLVYVACETPTVEMVTLTFSGLSMDAIERGRDAVIAQLSAIVPTERASRETERKNVVEAEEVARKRRATTREKLGEFIAKHGDDPDAQLASVRNRRGELGKRVDSLERDLASRTATRDYLKAFAEERRAAFQLEQFFSPDLAPVAADLKQAEATLAELMKTRTEKHPDVVKAKAVLTSLQNRLHGADREPRLVETESRLFTIEEDLFTMSREREWSVGELSKLEAEERDWVARVAKYRELGDDVRRLDNEFEIASARKRASDQEWARDSGGAWIRVLSQS